MSVSRILSFEFRQIFPEDGFCCVASRSSQKSVFERFVRDVLHSIAELEKCE